MVPDLPPSSRTFTRRGTLALAVSIPFSGCLGAISSVMGNQVPPSVPTDLRQESLGVVDDEGTIDIVTDADLTLVYFFATWCGPCGPQREELREVREEYDPETLAMRAVSPEDDEQEVVDYWEDHEVEYPACTDPDSDIHSEFGVSAYPSLVLVDGDGDGDVRWHTSGTADADEIIEQVDDELVDE
ncbi:TlpA family protein disulfide reductase [Natrarchaeobius chitinivorans]|uniref:TlpA family protein disulfide reductase n=1 Tax=Natrarchaeobius chitinivorans TaxID=1679083 RepID=A0A3N6PDX3_NATCH|nr:TlpA disulfide reductase family protein [Natrarchaeobius chitinivorans]RQG97929.1 TlpA family protein disulfide reductase [Natrarchaeobius chitinivorans]